MEAARVATACLVGQVVGRVAVVLTEAAVSRSSIGSQESRRCRRSLQCQAAAQMGKRMCLSSRSLGQRIHSLVGTGREVAEMVLAEAAAGLAAVAAVVAGGAVLAASAATVVMQAALHQG